MDSAYDGVSIGADMETRPAASTLVSEAKRQRGGYVMPTTPGRLRARYDLTARDLAEATGAHLRTVRKWEAAEGDIAIQERFTTGLEALETVLDELQDFSLPFIHTWLRQPKRGLDDLSPREALGQGRWEEVLHQARLTRAGAPPMRRAEQPAPTADGAEGGEPASS
jgi:hypothetical protein